MKQGWEIKKIKDICEKASSNIAQNKITSLDGDYPVYGASGFVQNVDFYHRDTEYIGIVKDGSGVGRVNIYPAYSSLLGTLQYILPKKGHSLYFVAYALKSLNLARYAAGAAIPHIYFKDYGEATISVPSLAEQERIVEVLDREFERIDALKANAEQNLQHAKDLFQAALRQELQCDKYHALNEVYNIKTGKLNSNAAEEGGIYPFFTCSREIFAINTYAFDCEAILLAGNNASGDFNVKYYNGKFNAYQRTYVITAKNVKTNVRILYYILTHYLAELKQMSLGANTKFLKLGMIEGIRIPDVNEHQMRNVVARLDILNERCKALEENYKKTIALCDDMKQALLRKAFNGEL